MISTDGLSAPKIETLKQIGKGEWADVYRSGDRIFKAIYKDDSDSKMSAKVKTGARLQNKVSKIAPKVYSVGLRRDGRIWIEMEYLDGFVPVHNSTIKLEQTKAIASTLAANNIAHNDINSGNILVNGTEVKIIDFDAATEIEGGTQSDRNLLTRIGNFF